MCIRDRADIKQLLSDDYGRDKGSLITDNALNLKETDPNSSGTVYLCTADGEGNMVSFIQSNYTGFGSGIVIPETGIALNNRLHNFNYVNQHINCLMPHKKTYHTIIPGFLMKDGKALGPFGVMGAFMQPQGHVQVVSLSLIHILPPTQA